jgi:hypothetical protein
MEKLITSYRRAWAKTNVASGTQPTGSISPFSRELYANIEKPKMARRNAYASMRPGFPGQVRICDPLREQHAILPRVCLAALISSNGCCFGIAPLNQSEWRPRLGWPTHLLGLTLFSPVFVDKDVIRDSVPSVMNANEQ